MVTFIDELRKEFRDNDNVQNIYFDKFNDKLSIVFKLKDVRNTNGIPTEYKGFNIIITDKIDAIFDEKDY